MATKQMNKQGTKMPKMPESMKGMMVDPSMMDADTPRPSHKLVMTKVKTQAIKPPKK